MLRYINAYIISDSYNGYVKVKIIGFALIFLKEVLLFTIVVEVLLVIFVKILRWLSILLDIINLAGV